MKIKSITMKKDNSVITFAPNYPQIFKPRGMRSEDCVYVNNTEYLTYTIESGKTSLEDFSKEFNFFNITVSEETISTIYQLIVSNHNKTKPMEEINYADDSEEANLARKIIKKYGHCSKNTFITAAYNYGRLYKISKEVVLRCIMQFC